MVFTWLKRIFSSKLFLFLFIALILILCILYFSNKLFNDTVQNSGSSVSSAKPIPVNYSNFAKELSKNSIVKAIPSDAPILLRFYNFRSGSRQWEKSYLLTSSGVVETSQTSADIVLSIDSRYLTVLTSNNFCAVIQKANENGDLGFETSLSSLNLAWKYKSLMQYKSCFGL